MEDWDTELALFFNAIIEHNISLKEAYSHLMAEGYKQWKQSGMTQAEFGGLIGNTPVNTIQEWKKRYNKLKGKQ